MASTTDDILTVAQAKAELRIPADDVDHDALLQRHIAQAAAWVGREIGAPLVDVEQTRYAAPTGADQPITVDDVVAFRRVDGIAYWPPDGALREEPGGAVTGWGRIEIENRRIRVWPPADGWPAVLPGSCLQVRAVCGIDFDAVVDDLRAAVVLGVRQLFDGAAEIRPTAAIYALVAPWRRYD